jgi:hypothetical protein
MGIFTERLSIVNVKKRCRRIVNRANIPSRFDHIHQVGLDMFELDLEFQFYLQLSTNGYV